jgi:diguanylate cyclase (GGDEF)-like protein
VRVANRALARNQRQLRHQSEHDALTGLSNRRHAQARLQGRREAERFRGGLLMLDIDHFKQINDRHGHAAGDAVLVQVAARLSQALGPGALAARWGGEEFLVALPEPLAPQALRALARRLLQALSATPVTLPDGQPLTVSASIGHAGFPLPPHGLPLGLDQAINLVDMALYLAKAQGRHRAVGLARAEASDAAALRRLEADLERALRDGLVQLDIDAGPPVHTTPPIASAAAAATPAAAPADSGRPPPGLAAHS